MGASGEKYCWLGECPVIQSSEGRGQAGDVRSREPEAEVPNVQLEVQAVGGGHDGIQELPRAQGRRGK